MSIRDEIAACERDGRLRHLVPALEHEPVVRHLFATEAIAELVLGPWDDPAWETRRGRLRADLDAFIRGDILTVAEQPFRAKAAYMARLFPGVDEVWEIRSRDPKPGLRIFGRFAERNVFVALNWSDRTSLGPQGSREWATAIRTCKAEWRKLFATYEPISGMPLDDYAPISVLV